MPLFEVTREDLVECKPVTFTHLEIKERAGLQHVLRDHIEVPGEDLRLIAKEYGDLGKMRGVSTCLPLTSSAVWS